MSIKSRIKYLTTLIPLSQRKLLRYPRYQKGNPQLRLFLPQFWMKMIKPEKDCPPDRVTFIVHPQMSKIDIKNYLEKIYKVSPIQIKTEIRAGEEIKHPTRQFVLTHEDDYKMAYIYLGKEENFTFPDIFGGKKTESEVQLEEWKKSQEMLKETEIKEWDKMSVPPWFR